MSYMYCDRCGYKKLIPIAKYRFMGIGISAFGVFGWFSFLFAGSGHAFLIACSIFFLGIYFFYNAEDLAKSSLRDKPCPKCNGTICEDSDPFDKKDQCIDVEVLKLKNGVNSYGNMGMPKSLFLNQENTNYKKEKYIHSDELDDFFSYKVVMSSAKKIPHQRLSFMLEKRLLFMEM